MNKIQNYLDQFNQPNHRLGATYVPGEGVYIRLWAPKAKIVSIEWVGKKTIPLERQGSYFTGHFPDAKPGDRYWFYLHGTKRIADPASRFQSSDTNGPSEVVASDFQWTDTEWKNVPFQEWVIYEIHTGTYSTSHDFDGIIADLPRLKDLGITTIELMPVSQFSGTRNWGYDGVFPHAVQHSYGGPEKLKALVNACHAHGLAIILDVVYNHLGPEGNVLFDCGPYASETYKTPWGPGPNFDGEYSPDVRRYFLQSVWQWLTEYHFDGLRLDSVHMMYDSSPVPFLQDLHHIRQEAEKVRGHQLIIIGEIDNNDSRVVQPIEQNGFALDAHWSNDLYSALTAILTDVESKQDSFAQLARIYERGIAFEDEYIPDRKRYQGRSYHDIPYNCLVVESQNHDQVGNRPWGERLITRTDFERAKLAAAAVLLSPFTPFLFMGEEVAWTGRFLYFISHHDPAIKKLSRKTRVTIGSAKDAPDPADESSFLQSVLTTSTSPNPDQAAVMTIYYKQLIALSKEVRRYGRPHVIQDPEQEHIVLTYSNKSSSLQVLLAFKDQATDFRPRGGQVILYSQKEILDSSDSVAPYSVTVWRN